MTDGPPRDDLRQYLRDERPPDESVIVIRGGPTTAAKLAGHARRTHDAYVLDGSPVSGVSVFCALDDIGPASLDGLLRRFASYRTVHLPLVRHLQAAGFELLPTFGRPHFTIRLSSIDGPEIAALLAALGSEQSNPYHGRRPGRR